MGTSGGIFLDSAIHDMDLMRWFLGSEAAEVYAMGCTFKHPAFQDAGDDETGVAVYKFKNGAMGMVHVGRTAPYGYHIETEIVGTEGTIRISAVPEKNRAMVYDVNGPEPNVWNPSRSGLRRRTSRKWRNLSAASEKGGSRIPAWRTASMPHGWATPLRRRGKPGRSSKSDPFVEQEFKL